MVTSFFFTGMPNTASRATRSAVVRYFSINRGDIDNA